MHALRGHRQREYDAFVYEHFGHLLHYSYTTTLIILRLSVVLLFVNYNVFPPWPVMWLLLYYGSLLPLLNHRLGGSSMSK